jgi:hypothetical protein
MYQYFWMEVVLDRVPGFVYSKLNEPGQVLGSEGVNPAPPQGNIKGLVKEHQLTN